jgi:hypothetical protein
VIEPYRTYINEHDLYGKSGIATLGHGLVEVLKYPSRYTPTNDITLASQIASRFDLLGMSATGIAFTNAGGVDPATRGKLLQSIILSPILAFVPRALWQDKPSYNTGTWFNQIVLGKRHDSITSVGMGPLALTNMAGGVFGVFACFLCLGWLQAMLFEGAARSGVGGIIIYLSVIITLVTIPTEFGLAIGGLFRILPFAVIAQHILLHPSSPRKLRRTYAKHSHRESHSPLREELQANSR